MIDVSFRGAKVQNSAQTIGSDIDSIDYVHDNSARGSARRRFGGSGTKSTKGIILCSTKVPSHDLHAIHMHLLRRIEHILHIALIQQTTQYRSIAFFSQVHFEGKGVCDEMSDDTIEITLMPSIGGVELRERTYNLGEMGGDLVPGC